MKRGTCRVFVESSLCLAMPSLVRPDFKLVPLQFCLVIPAALYSSNNMLIGYTWFHQAITACSYLLNQ